MDVLTWAKKTSYFLPRIRFFYPIFVFLNNLTIKQMK